MISKNDLKAMPDGSWSVRVTPAGTPSLSAEQANFQLAVIGPDRPGIVREISKALADSGDQRGGSRDTCLKRCVHG